MEVLRIRDQISGLKAQLTVANKELEDRRNEQQRILREINTYQNRVEILPVREQEMAQITRDYEISKTNYKTLLDKKLAAEMALDMERRQKSERFTVLDPARIPEKPVKPKRPMLYGIGIAGSLVFAVVFGLCLELRRNVFLGEWELPDGTPVLARLPYIEIPATAPAAAEPEPPVRGKKRLAPLSAALLSLISLIAAGLYFLRRL
jgi:hypothetical protein